MHIGKTEGLFTNFLSIVLFISKLKEIHFIRISHDSKYGKDTTKEMVVEDINFPHDVHKEALIYFSKGEKLLWFD